MKKIIAVVSVVLMVGCAEVQKILSQLPSDIEVGKPITQLDISNGLKAALDKGIREQVTKLTLKNGFLGNQAVKILLPSELRNVERSLRNVGLGNLADEGVKLLNRAAEDAVKEAIPIFSNAVTTMSFTDAKNILLGENNAATNYLEVKTKTALYEKFSPVIKTSFAKVGADKIWRKIITTYNQIPFMKKINSDLTDYTTQQALGGVFKMIAVEEEKIRTKYESRTTNLLRRVFALQDNRRAPYQEEKDTYFD